MICLTRGNCTSTTRRYLKPLGYSHALRLVLVVHEECGASASGSTGCMDTKNGARRPAAVKPSGIDANVNSSEGLSSVYSSSGASTPIVSSIGSKAVSPKLRSRIVRCPRIRLNTDPLETFNSGYMRKEALSVRL